MAIRRGYFSFQFKKINFILVIMNKKNSQMLNLWTRLLRNHANLRVRPWFIIYKYELYNEFQTDFGMIYSK